MFAFLFEWKEKKSFWAILLCFFIKNGISRSFLEGGCVIIHKQQNDKGSLSEGLLLHQTGQRVNKFYIDWQRRAQ